jgi:hypothetical protein
MGKLKDYSGPLRQNVKLTDFSSETLARLVVAAAKLYVGLDGLWYNLIKERFGEQMACELDRELWRRAEPFEVNRTREALNIMGSDVASFLKFCQCDPGSGVFMDMDVELSDENHGIMTIKRCNSLEYFERHGETVLQKNACDIDVWGFPKAASRFNPDMKVTPLKLPPRKSKDGIACQWEVKIEKKT